MKYALLILLIAFLGYNSIYFEKISERNNVASTSFDFMTYADSLYTQGILKAEKPIAIDQLISEIKKDKNQAFEEYGNFLGIGNSAYFMVQVNGKLMEKSDAQLKVLTESGKAYPIETQFIFGNAIRDASKLVKLTDFKTNAEFNALSEALNTRIREKAIPQYLEAVQEGDEVQVTGAIKLSKNEDLAIKIIPVKIEP